MQNVEGEGDFDHFQSIWRVQNLPGCAPEGADAARLTYAVELRPKGFLPVRLIEGRIASDLIGNLDALKKNVEERYQKRKSMEKMSSVQSKAAAAVASVDHSQSTANPTTITISKQQQQQQQQQEQATGSISSDSTSEIEMQQQGLQTILNTIRSANDIPRNGDLLQENKLLRERIAQLTGEIIKTRKLLNTIQEMSRLE
jgi:hypothetical protein